LPHGVRLVHNKAHGGWGLLAPERVFKADPIAAEIGKRCTGQATVSAIVNDLAQTYSAPRDRILADVSAMLRQLAERKLLELGLMATHEPDHLFPTQTSGLANGGTEPSGHWPIGLLAELTHRCPLGCPYCSNPLTLDRRESELDSSTWTRVFEEAA